MTTMVSRPAAVWRGIDWPSRTARGTAGGGAGWTVGTVLVAALVSIPVLAVPGIALTPADGIWRHLASTVLPSYIANTLLLMLGVGAGTLLVGVGTAWLVTVTRFPGRGLAETALLLPMALPAYVVAYVYTDLLEYAGPLQKALRGVFGWSGPRDYWFPEIRSLGGAVVVMTLVLYPYVYLLSRAAFIEQSVGLLEASRSLGRGPWRTFFTTALPLARPAIVVGVSLVLMETLNDFGTVDFFAVPTFTLGIFDVWRNMNSIAGAAQLSSLLLLFVMVLVFLERGARRRRRFDHAASRHQALSGERLAPPLGVLAVVACFTPVVLGFGLPASVLAAYAVTHFADTPMAEVLAAAANSVLLAGIAAALALMLALFMAYGARIKGGMVIAAASRLAGMGYAVPGSVLAVGVMVVLAGVDNGVDAFMRDTFGVSTGLLLSGTIAAVTFGYLVRFLALALGTVEAGLSKITPSMDGAARSLGHGPLATMRRVHVPLLRSSLLTAAVLVFVDSMKELPMTVILQPFDFQTLATFVHQYASDEQLGEAALAALAIVAAGIAPVVLLSRAIGRSRPGHGARETAS